MSGATELIHNSLSCAVSSSLMSHITLIQQSHTVILHNAICSHRGGVALSKSFGWKKNPTRNEYQLMTSTEFHNFLSSNLHDNLARAAKITATGRHQLTLRQKTQTHWVNCSTLYKQTDAERATQDQQTWRWWRKWSGAASEQKCSWFYLQRRHDIPCPLKPATERCSPCSCCRRPSLANTSTAKRMAAKNPIGLTGTLPNSSKWRH